MHQINLDKALLLEQASAKVMHLREIRETLAAGQHASREVKQCLVRAAEAIQKLSRLEACFGKAEAERIDGGVALQGGPQIIHQKLAARMNKQSSVYTYALSLGYDSKQMMTELKGDYSIYHFHYYLGRTLLQLIGREFIRQVRAGSPDYQWSRFPVLVQMEGEPFVSLKNPYWDPQRIAQLLPLFRETRTHFSVTEAGCISPLFSIVGIMLRTPVTKSEATGT